MHRLDVVLLLCNEQSISKVADIFEINAITIQRWVRRLNKFGFEGLRDKTGRGRRSLLSEAGQVKLKKILKNRPTTLAISKYDGIENFYHTILKETTMLRLGLNRF